MGFTFQINKDVQFCRNEQLLEKAQACIPQLHRTEVFPQRYVKAVDDAGMLGGIGVRETAAPEDALGKGDTVILDFGRHVTGSFSAHIDHHGSPMDAPLWLKIRFAEVPFELTSDINAYDGWLSSSWIQEESVHMDVLPAELVLSRRYSFRYVMITVMDTSPKWKVSFDRISVQAVSSAPEVYEPLQVHDDMLRKIADVSTATLAECMQEVFEDGPKRDRRLWLGDLRLQALADYAVFGETDIVRHCMYLFAAMTASDGRISANVFTSPEYQPDDSFLFDYSLFLTSVLYDYERFRYDEETLRDLYPVCRQMMVYARTFVDEGGCLRLPEEYPVFIDWSDAFDKSTAGQAVMIFVLRQFIELAGLYGEDAGEWQDLLARMERYAVQELFDENTGMFVSGAHKEINIASQVWMVLAGVLDHAHNHELMRKAVQELFPVHGIATPYMYHHIVQALFEAGLDDEAVSLMKAYWGKMIAMGADTFWEAFDPERPEYSPYGSPVVSSFCHAWSCTPVWLIRKYINREEF